MKTKSAVGWMAIGSLGVVFGDIGTSPIYTLKTCIQAFLDPNAPATLSKEAMAKAMLSANEVVYGAVSLIVWYLLAVVSLKYVFFLLKFSNHGEGGVFALLALSKKYLPNAKWLVYVLICGAALLYGDGIITPAISVLSAVEGLAPPTLQDPNNAALTITNPNAWANPYITAVILAILFGVQRFGTDKISKAFAPIMVVWFFMLAAMGIVPIFKNPIILTALNPLVGLGFLFHHTDNAMVLMASVTLAITGAEALYADLGHFGRPAISIAWNFMVSPCLILNYLGQGSMALNHLPQSDMVNNLFFNMVPSKYYILGIDAQFLLTLLSLAATIIASQALISAAFSLTRQAVNLGYCPRTTIKHTSAEHEGQIFLPAINLLLAAGSIGLVLIYKQSANLADAYGLAVTSTMVTTTIAYASISYAITKKIPYIAILLMIMDISLLIPNTTKFTTGGYIPVSVGVVVAFVLISWDTTRRRLRAKMADRVVTLKELAESTVKVHRIRNTGIVLSATPKIAPITLLHWLKIGQVLHEQVIVLTLIITGEPYVPKNARLKIYEHEGRIFGVEAEYGFMEEIDISKLEPELREIVKAPATRQLYYLLGRESLIIENNLDFMASTYRLLASASRPMGESYHIPPGQTIEIGTSIRL